MSKTTTEKRMNVEEQIKQLENQRKQLIQKERDEERKKRTHRLCKRGGIAEKLLPELAALTDEQFDIFIQKVLLSEHTKRVIADITEQKTIPPAAAQGGIFTKQGKNTAVSETAEAERSGN